MIIPRTQDNLGVTHPHYRLLVSRSSTGGGPTTNAGHRAPQRACRMRDR
jgi:hypothetical protein